MLISGGELVLSDTTPAFARQNYYPNTGLNLTALFASYGTIYRNQLWVFVVVRKRSLATARLPLKVYERTDAGRAEARDTPYAQLLRKPNPKHDPFFLWLWTSSTVDVYGEAMWVKVRGSNGQPKEVWPMHPSLVQIRRIPNEATGETETFYGYLGGMAATVPVLLIPERDVVHFKGYNPDTTARGMSPLEPLRQTIVNEDAARRASSAFWANGSRPSVVLSTDGNFKNNLPALERLKADWEAIHKGVDNFGKTAILEEGLTPHIISQSAEESQYEASRRLNREEVCACYDMPPTVVGILDHATFANVTELQRSLYRDTMAPHLGGLESTLDHQLRPDFGADALYAEFLMDEVLRGDFELRSDAYQKGINSGWIKPSEVRRAENMPDAGPDADRLFINSTIIPIDATSRRTTPEPAAPDDIIGPTSPPGAAAAPGATATPPAGPKSLSTAQVRSVLGRLGRYKALDDVDPGRLTAGLNGETEVVLDALASAKSIDDLRLLIKSLEGAA